MVGDSTKCVVESVEPRRFMATARWRCEGCESPWTATRTAARATTAALDHLDEEHRGG